MGMSLMPMRSARDDNAVNSIPISDHMARSHVSGKRLGDLTRYSAVGRVVTLIQARSLRTSRTITMPYSILKPMIGKTDTPRWTAAILSWPLLLPISRLALVSAFLIGELRKSPHRLPLLALFSMHFKAVCALFICKARAVTISTRECARPLSS